MPYEPPPELTALSLGEIADLVTARRLPPVTDWTPSETLDSGIEIRADGSWYHEGGRIERPAMVRAFSSLLMRDAAGDYWLCTPHQRHAVQVVDAAFVAVDVVAREGALVFRLNTDDLIVAGPDHPLRAAGTAEQPAIYLGVRHGCEARINRSTWLQLVELADGDDWAVTSQGLRFPLVPA
ncbi:DUF1285 domain-containing protein [Novosphingobium piscinae]|uniref:DUF1285 domain-containing protein n=1 Tax=Novosphingobium piscinae TaxID=1507448 RepID=A0A7X1FX88_9SPHN|nr:DUF1285 domain-containing protein [Novosphingobium piscinae]MBC2668693.1 DUF1285 domain-containing protein [Novosphingobium piscinae]